MEPRAGDDRGNKSVNAAAQTTAIQCQARYSFGDSNRAHPIRGRNVYTRLRYMAFPELEAILAGRAE
jgi:hypothetical protein